MFICGVVSFLLAYTKFNKLTFCTVPILIIVSTIGYIRFVKDFFEESEDIK